MSVLFSENSIVGRLLMLGVIAMAMSLLDVLHPWIAGCGSFLLMTIVVAIAALHGDRRTTALIVGVATILSSGVCWFTGGDLSLSLTVFISSLSSVTLGVLGGVICTTSHERIKQVNELVAHQSELVRRVYDYERSSSLSGEIPTLGVQSAADASSNTSEPAEAKFGLIGSESLASDSSPVIDPDMFDFAMLLLSMQQIGHRLSAELELETLVSAILDTSKDVLRCQHAELHLWNAREDRFSNAVHSVSAPRSNSVQGVLNQAASPPASFQWVKQQHRILTRRDVLAGKVEVAELSEGLLPVAVAPLLVGDDLVGVLVVSDAEDEGPTFVRMLHILANHCALSLKNSQLFRTIQEMARRDGLTGLLNHAPFLDELEHLIDEATSQNRPLTLVMSDLDHFKDFNDNYGHQAGDKVLQEVSNWWRAIMPDHAILGRYGGEEFICALPDETLDRGIELAELLRVALVSHPVSHNGIQLHVTASFGVAELGNPANNATRLIRLADKALYRAKDDGRNCVEAHDPSRPDIATMSETAQFTLR